MLVFLATDVEVWPRLSVRAPDRFREDFRRDIYGPTTRGDYGLPFQLKLLAEYDLKAVFLVDALFASVFGLDYLREIIDLIRGGGQEVQLHAHTEWVDQIDGLLPGRSGRNIRDFTRKEQRLVFQKSLENMAACGAEGLCAYRAGNFGANWDTLEALADNGIRYDTSYNYPYLGRTCDLKTDPPLVQPARYGRIIEFPLTFFRQGPSLHRHVQVGACSFSELASMMQQALRRGWHSFQILSHNFELLTPAKTKPDWITVKRFEKLCAFLADHRDTLPTAWFADLVFDEIPTDIQDAPLHSHWLRTAYRLGEQITRRILS